MPTIKEFLKKYSISQIKDVLEKTVNNEYTVRDNTRTSLSRSSGYVPAKEKPITDRQNARFDDGLMGFIPVVGDVLQGAQAVRDFSDKKYAEAAIGAGMLFLPNILEKTGRVLAPTIKQVLKDGTVRELMHHPLQTIQLADAIERPYRGQNFIHHGIDMENVADVLNGETRTMSPSFSVNRWGDFNGRYVPGFYGDGPVFIGDKSMLDKSKLFRGDAMTPTVSEVFYGFQSVPSYMREQVAEDIWKKMEIDGTGKGLLMDPSELDWRDIPLGDYYFEGKYHGTYPLEKFKHALLREPANKKEEDVIRALEERGLPITTYPAVGGMDGYFQKNNTLLNVLNEHPEYMFDSGGRLNINGDGGKFMTVSSGYAPLMYTPSPEVRPDVQVPFRYYPEPNNGDYEYPSSTGMLKDYPITVSAPVAQSGLVLENTIPSTTQAVVPVVDDSAAREERMWRQWYAESAFNNSAKSHAGAQGAFQIMPITYKDYLGRGKGKPGDLNNPVYNRKIRDFVLSIIPRDLGAFWSEESPSDVNLAKRYAAYNWGAGSLRKYLRKKQEEGVDIHNSLAWLSGLPKETRDYVNFIVFNQDVPDTSKTQALYEAARKKYNGKSMGGVIEKLSKIYGNDRAAMLSALRKNRY